MNTAGISLDLDYLPRLCEQAGITLAVNQNMRYDQSVRGCKCLLDRGVLGEPVFASIDMRTIPHWMPWQPRLGWVTLRIMSIHHLDTFRDWFGDPVRVFASVRDDPRTSRKFAHAFSSYSLVLYLSVIPSFCQLSSCPVCRPRAASGVRWETQAINPWHISDPTRRFPRMTLASDDGLTGKTAVVTGSSSGIGRAIALELATAGADVVIHARTSRAAAEAAADEVRARGRQAAVLLADLADVSAHAKLIDAAWAWRGGVHVWVNNAGADVLTGEAAGLSFEEKLDRLWRVDVLATIRLSRLAGGRMRQQASRTDPGVILNLGWDQAEHGMGGDSGEMFAAVKGAVMAFTRSLACSLAPVVRVNCLAPGWIKTAWGERASEYWQARAQRESLLQRWGTPEDVAHVARFLASPAAEFITGQVIPINGGLRHGLGK